MKRDFTHRHQHAPALPDGSTASQKADDQQHRANGDEQVADISQLG